MQRGCLDKPRPRVSEARTFQDLSLCCVTQARSSRTRLVLFVDREALRFKKKKGKGRELTIFLPPPVPGLSAKINWKFWRRTNSDVPFGLSLGDFFFSLFLALFFQGIPLPILGFPLILSYPGQSCSLSGSCHRTASHLLLPPLQCLLYVRGGSVQSHFCLQERRCRRAHFNLLFCTLFLKKKFGCVSVVVPAVLKQTPYISKHKAAAAGKRGPLRSCSNVNVWSFIWSSDVILMMEELLLWTAGLVRRNWV